MPNSMIPRPIQTLLAVQGIGRMSRAALASPFFISAVMKLGDLDGAAAEMAQFGLEPPLVFAVLTIATQLVGSALLMTQPLCWLGAGILAVFTMMATVLAHPFWQFEGVEAAHQTATFLEHVAIVGGLALAALIVNRRR